MQTSIRRTGIPLHRLHDPKKTCALLHKRSTLSRFRNCHRHIVFSSLDDHSNEPIPVHTSSTAESLFNHRVDNINSQEQYSLPPPSSSTRPPSAQHIAQFASIASSPPSTSTTVPSKSKSSSLARSIPTTTNADTLQTLEEKQKAHDLRFFLFGAAAAVSTHYLINFAGTLPIVRRLVRQFIWWAEPKLPALSPLDMFFQSRDASLLKKNNEDTANANNNNANDKKNDNTNEIFLSTDPSSTAAVSDAAANALALFAAGMDGESVEWVNMCWRKAWRVYQRGLERWLADLLQPVFDNLVADGAVPKFIQRLRIMEFTLDHEASSFSNMRRRNSRKDSDLNGVVDVRYTGGARMLLLIECGTGRWRIKIPVMVSDLDLECKMWLKIRLAPMCPYIGTLSLAFVGPPTIKVQLAPYNRVRLMRIPILQPFLAKLLTVDLPALMTLPRRLEINIPPAVTAVAEAAVGRDAVMRAVASAVLQADALEHALVSALPLGPQGAAGGISLPDTFRGELQVYLREAKDLPVWGFPWQSNPYCRLALGTQAVRSRRDNETSQTSRHRAPVWNQEFQFLVEDPTVQALELWVRDSPITGRTDVGYVKIDLSSLPADGMLDAWLPVESATPGEMGQGAVHLTMTYKNFQDDEGDSGYREAAAFAAMLGESREGEEEITDVKSAADASSRAAVAASAAAAAVAVAKAAAARAAARIARGKRQKEEEEEEIIKGAANASNNSKSSSNTNGNVEETHARETQIQGEEEDTSATDTAKDHAALVNSLLYTTTTPTVTDGLPPLPSITKGTPTPINTINDPIAQEAAVKQLEDMAETMQRLTGEVQQLNSSKASSARDALAAETAAKAVATAEALAVAAVLAGDIPAANKALQEAAAALEKTAIQFAAAASGSDDDDVDNAMDFDDGMHPHAGEHVTLPATATLWEIAHQSGAEGSVNLSAQKEEGEQQLIETDDIGKSASTATAVSAQTLPPSTSSPPLLDEPVDRSQAASTPQERAAQALAAAQAAATAAALAVEAALSTNYHNDDDDNPTAGDGSSNSSSNTRITSRSGRDQLLTTDDDDNDSLLLAPETIPGTVRNTINPTLSSIDDDSVEEETVAPWWNQALSMVVPGIPSVHNVAADVVADADGSAIGLPKNGEEGEGKKEGKGKKEDESNAGSSSSPWWMFWQNRDKKEVGDEEKKETDGDVDTATLLKSDEPVSDVFISPDLPLEEIAAEVQNSWKLRDRHVETLVQKALQSRQRESERPWLVMTTVMATSSAILLAIVLYRITQSF